MNLRLITLVFVLGLSLLGGCKKDDTNPQTNTVSTNTDLIVATNWRINRLADANGNALKDSQLDAETIALKYFDFQFKADMTVRAIDSITRQIRNGGDWKFTADNTGVDVNVTGFKGIFPLLTLTRTSLVLQQTAKVNGTNTPIRLEFIPAV
jgi:hypothetical protein